MTKKEIAYTIGIDEAGRGPLAGPVSVGVVAIPAEHRDAVLEMFALLQGRDSKKWSEKRREEWFEQICEAKRAGLVTFSGVMVGARSIDEMGIVYTINAAMARGLERLEVDPVEARVLLDGGLRAPAMYANQESIVKGDEKEIVIAMASIVAKVTRDRHMRSLAEKYPVYGFGVHKGYGTAKHYAAIEEHGMCEEHRRSFLKGRGMSRNGRG
ncbi:MAG: ribonuclease HII [Candidatus Yonathbacteria bacterium]|nr:ribonuclease HII [Candidatus Yonathbacteria bacterium]